MEIPSSSPVYTPLKPRPRRAVEPPEPVVLFPSDPAVFDDAPRAVPADGPADGPASNADAHAVLAAREESVICSSDEEEGCDTDADATHVEDELRWSLAQRPPRKMLEPRKPTVIEDSMYEPEPLELPGSTSSLYDGEETIMSDDDEAQHTDSDANGVGIYDASQPKSTQNFLSELLTESLLESLPLPPDRKQRLREAAR